MTASETTTSFPISLRPWQKEDDDSKAQSLGELIFRMHNERKGFRHITEEALTKELRDEESGLRQEDDEEVEDVDEEDEKGTSKYIAKKRMDMFHLLRYVFADTWLRFGSDSCFVELQMNKSALPKTPFRCFNPSILRPSKFRKMVKR